MEHSYRVRIHSIGGEGGVIASEVLAEAIGTLTSFHILQSPFFGTERSGAPAITYLSFSKSSVRERGTIEQPNGLVVFNTKLFSVVPGLLNGFQNRKGKLIVNTDRDSSELKGFAREVFTIDATGIARRLMLGSTTFTIPNTAMIGAMLKAYEEILNLQPHDVQKWIEKKVPVKVKENLEAVRIGFESLRKLKSSKVRPLKNVPVKPLPFAGISVTILPSSVEKTGGWATLIPQHQEGRAPCSHHCPAGIEVRRFVALLAQDKIREARKVILDRSPLPSVCGRVCPHFCEMNCNRRFLEGTVKIGQIERFLGDSVEEDKIAPFRITKKQKIAIVGAGPGGLTAGWQLLRNGYKATLFEKGAEPGGLLIQGIPDYRLPKDVVRREILALERAGLEIRTGVEVGTQVEMERLATEFDAIILAVGRHVGRPLRIEGEPTGIQGVIQGIDFLKDSKAGKESLHIAPTDRVIVVGGGNTAVDSASSALRWITIQGNMTPEVTICYRREMKDMPAFGTEVERVQKEGVHFTALLTPKRIVHEKGLLRGVEFLKCTLEKIDETGRGRPVPLPGSEITLPCDKLIIATGQSFKLPYSSQKEHGAWKEGWMDTREGIPIFFLDDLGTVAQGIGAAHRISQEVMKAFDRKQKPSSESKEERVVQFEDLNLNYIERRDPIEVRELAQAKSILSFSEIVEPYTETEAEAEANRCISCGACNACDNCYRYCPDMAVIKEDGSYRVNLDYCKGCLVCVQECPRHVIEITQSPSLEGSSLWLEKVQNFKIIG